MTVVTPTGEPAVLERSETPNPALVCEWMGGLTGYIWGGWLHLNFVWVMEALRRQGYGSQLMDAAEAFAAERGAFAATLETHSFQAPEFYAKRGYAIFGQLDDYPPGHTKLFLRKRLGAVLS